MTVQAFDPREFRNALSSFATGVTVVTTVAPDGNDVGLTANSFNSVSLDPPMILWSLARASSSLPAFQAAEYFAVHILSSEQQALSNRFASRDVDRFEGLTLSRGPANIPLLEDFGARFQCRTAHQYEGGDHIIFVGEVIGFARRTTSPLIYHGGDYALAARMADALSADEEKADYSLSKAFLGNLLGTAHARLYAEVGAALDRHELGETGHGLLSALALEDDQNLSAMAAILGDDTTIVEAAANALVDRGLLHRQAGMLRVTDAGRDVLHDISNAARQAEARALGPLSESERADLKDMLVRLGRSAQ
ncbi:flavin reductase [Pacificimonas sp. WHA3]|uniref:Flavin reductase n=1 Tax=Pacificimonas pallii TaxID=2827236 RepID=A0ABS6SGY9_9SPHN|nr:flavin reductase [Pacificimonas pallii]MBV7257186.1 flavin reductase [Pacificimonas pallii]